MLVSTNPGLIGLAVSASLAVGAAARAESIDAATSQPALSGGPRPIDACGDCGMTTNNTLYGATTCGLGWNLQQTCPGDRDRSRDVVNVTDLLEPLAAWGDCPEA
jgi:hypothetical protein